MDSVERKEPGEVLTTQDVSLLRSLELKRLGKRFAIDSVLFASVLAGAKIAYFGDWHVLGDLENLVGGVFVATLSALGHVSLSRRLLGRTSDETRLQMRKDWHVLTDPGWPIRLMGVSAGAAAFFTIFSLALVAMSEPIPGAWEVVVEGLRMFGTGFLVLAPVAFLARATLVKGLRREAGRDLGQVVPGVGTAGQPGDASPSEKK